MSTDNNGAGQVASEGLWKGLHPGMGLASKVMVLCFVLFTALYVDLANSIYSAVRGWIESTLNFAKSIKQRAHRKRGDWPATKQAISRPPPCAPK